MAESEKRKIIRVGAIPKKPTFRFRCPVCSTEWEYNDGNVEYIRLVQIGGDVIEARPCRMSDVCPLCGEQVSSTSFVREKGDCV